VKKKISEKKTNGPSTMGLSFQTPPKREQNTGRVEKNKASRLFDVNTPGKLKF